MLKDGKLFLKSLYLFELFLLLVFNEGHGKGHGVH